MGKPRGLRSRLTFDVSRLGWVAMLAGLALISFIALRLLWRQDQAFQQVQAAGVWRVGLDPSFPPFESLDEATGQPIGFDVDLAQAIAARWGVRAQIVPAGFDELVDAASAHRIDAVISAMPASPWRVKEVSFSQPYVEAGVVLAAPPELAITGTLGLAGRRVAVEWGSEGDAQARELARRLEPAPQLVAKESPEVALEAVARGEADAAIVDAISLALYNRNGTRRLVIAGPPLRSDPYVVVVAHDAPGMLAAVNDALAALEADGTLGRLRAKWLDEDQ